MQDAIRTVNVIRHGELMECAVASLAVGDLYCIRTGDIIPADGILVFFILF
jgi:magnesium-transporting ATPase (P-type)